MVKAITQTLFDLLAIGTRRSPTRFYSTELSWWSDLNGDLIGAVAIDLTDNDFAWVILARDENGQFRCADVDTGLPSERIAEAKLRIAMANLSRDSSFTGWVSQGDEKAGTLNLFEDRGGNDNRLNPYYRMLRDEPGRHPSRKVFEAISPWLISSDPHLVKEFQEGGFDQRLWEIYLWAVFRDQGYDVEHQEAPDLIVRNPLGSFAIEATTVAPSASGPLAVHPNPQTPEEHEAFLTHYMPMKFGSSLTSKLNKVDAEGRHYWERDQTKDIPFLLAIADFHKAANEDALGSMTYSHNALYTYLYGIRLHLDQTVDGPKPRYETISEHNYNGKIIPSGFFNLPNAENISAVIFSNAATLAKFDRMGVMAGYAPEDHRYIRIGMRFDPDPKAYVGKSFATDITDPEYEEFWGDELQVFHNSRAVRPLDPDAFPEAAHFFYENGQLSTIERPGRVLASFTSIFRIMKD